MPVYDRSGQILRAVDNLKNKLLEEFLGVAVVCFALLFHPRSAFVAIVSLPLGILTSFIVMYYQGVNANIMSLGGIAIAIGAVVDAAVVMIRENAHKYLEMWTRVHPGQQLEGDKRWRLIGDAVAEVGPALFFSLLIITLSFIPVFTLEAQASRFLATLCCRDRSVSRISVGSPQRRAMDRKRAAALSAPPKSLTKETHLMKSSARILVATMAITAGGAFAQAGMDDMKDMQTAKMAAPDKHSQQKATGTVKNADTDAGVVTLAHGPVPTLNWPANDHGVQGQGQENVEQVARGQRGAGRAFTKEGEDYVIIKVK